MKKLILVFFMMHFVSCAFCQIKILGYVKEKNTNLPIENAMVTLNQSMQFMFTDSLGFFSFQVEIAEPIHVSHFSFDFIYSMGINESAENKNIELKIYMKPKNSLFEEVIITGTRANYDTPIATTNISGATLNKNNFGEDMPMLLEFNPSVVVTSDAGNGVGYTGIRIRGTDATRISVTLNGVPYNDAESQQTYWVDIPDIAESIDDVQIQRGVGTSQNGLSSLGGSIQIYTNDLDVKPFARISYGIGSYQLRKIATAFGTGKINNHWFLEGRISKINANGFIERSFADLTSFAITASYQSNKYKSFFNVFSGAEKTYQSWGGVPKDSLETYRNFNPYTYENQTDNYTQTHYQWHHALYLNRQIDVNFSLNYTKGNGYYEQLETDQFLTDYGVQNFILGNDTIYLSDIVTQKWLDSKFYGASFQLNKEWSSQLNASIGGAIYKHDGFHFGKVIWSAIANPFQINDEWYRNQALKTDIQFYSILNYQLSKKINSYVDLQIRNVSYQFEGKSIDAMQLEQTIAHIFFNPKIGIAYIFNPSHTSFISVSKSGKEPNRDDYTESSPINLPLAEVLYDLELGHKLRVQGWEMQANFYFMHYLNQLVLTGEINDVGAYSRTNVPTSFRTGVELAWLKIFRQKFIWQANFTISKNKIQDFTTFIDNWDSGLQTSETYVQTDMAFSPGLVGANKFEYLFMVSQNHSKQSSFSSALGLQSKFVSRQYIDNTTSSERSLDPYTTHDLYMRMTLKSNKFQELNMGISVQNLLNFEYESNAWVYRYIYEGVEQELNGYFPQTGRNWNLFISIYF